MIEHRMTETATIERQSFVDGKRTGYSAHLSDVPCLPVMPVRPQEVADLQLDRYTGQGYDLRETYLLGDIDVQASDRITVGDDVYRVISVGTWSARRAFTKAILSKDRTAA